MQRLLSLALIALLCLLPCLLGQEADTFCEIRGRVLYLHDELAYLTIEASFAPTPYHRLIVLHYPSGKVQWEVPTAGRIRNCFPPADTHFITIESDHLLCRDTRNGRTIWDRDLRPIVAKPSTSKLFFPRDIDQNNTSFSYLTFMASPKSGFIFRQDFQGSGDIWCMGVKDWLQFDLETGRCVNSGTGALLEVGDAHALLSVDDSRLILLGPKGCCPLGPTTSKNVRRTLTEFFDSYQLLDQEQKCARPIRLDPLDTGKGVLVFNPGSQRTTLFKVLRPEVQQWKTVNAGRSILSFSECLRPEYTKSSTVPPSCIEAYDLDGKRTGRDAGVWGNNWLGSLGQSDNGDVFFELHNIQPGEYCLIRRYSLPCLKSISEYKLTDIRFIHDLMLGESGGAPVLSVVDNYLYNDYKFLKKKGQAHTLRFRFINLETGQKCGVFAPKILSEDLVPALR